MSEASIILTSVITFGVILLIVHSYFISKINQMHEDRAKILKFQRIKKTNNDRR